VSTRKADRLVQQLGLPHLSKDQVSRLCRGLDEQVGVFGERPLEGAYPYLWLDAKVERVREPGGVRHKALVIAYGVHASGRREVIGLDVGEAETEAFWREFLRGLRARGLDGMLLLEQNDEWLVGRRYLSESSMALVLATANEDQPDSPDHQEVPQLAAP
jgi:putative transposase